MTLCQPTYIDFMLKSFAFLWFQQKKNEQIYRYININERSMKISDKRSQNDVDATQTPIRGAFFIDRVHQVQSGCQHCQFLRSDRFLPGVGL